MSDWLGMIRYLWQMFWHESDPLNVCWAILIREAKRREGD